MPVPSTVFDETASVAANKALVRRYIEAYSDLTGATSEPLLHPDATIMLMARSTGLPLATTYNKDEYLQLFLGMSQVLPDGIVHHVRSMIAEGDRVAVETECVADLGNGRRYNNLFHFAFTLRDGQIVAIHEYCDFLHVKEALFDPAG